MTFAPANSIRPFLQSTVFFPKEPELFQVKLNEVYKDIAFNVNAREVGFFNLQEQLTGQQYFDPANTQKTRQAFRKVFSFGAIAPGATSTQAHGITGIGTFVHIYGTAITAAATFNQIPLPYVEVTNITNCVQVDADATDVRIINGATANAITSAIVVLEYLKT